MNVIFLLCFEEVRYFNTVKQQYKIDRPPYSNIIFKRLINAIKKFILAGQS